MEPLRSQSRPVVLVVGPLPPPHHGVSEAVAILVPSLKRQGIPVRHLDISNRRDLSNVDRFDWTNLRLGMQHAWQYLRMLLQSGRCVVYLPLCQTRLGFLRDAAFLVPARLLGRRRVLHMHGSRFRSVYDSSGRFLRGLIRFCIGGDSHVLVLGENLKGLFKGLVPDSRIHSLPNGIDGAALAREGARRLAAPQRMDGLRVLFFGTLTSAKGLHDALRAAARIAPRFPDVQFVFAGGFRYDSDQTLAEEIVRESGLADRVSFHGVTTGPAKVERFANADVFLFPSHDEGQPLVLLEAMAAGLPIVTTDVGAVAETVLNGHNGFVVRPHGVEQIAEAMSSILSDSELRLRMSRESLRRYESHYTMERFGDRLNAVMRAAIQQ